MSLFYLLTAFTIIDSHFICFTIEVIWVLGVRMRVRARALMHTSLNLWSYLELPLTMLCAGWFYAYVYTLL